MISLTLEAKYLGARLTKNMEPRQEVAKIIQEAMATWRRLAPFWKGSNCNARLKIQIWDAIVRSKIVYGLESLAMNDQLLRRLDVIHLKGLRQILRITTTHVNRTHTNEYVYLQATRAAYGRDKTDKQIRPLTKYIQEKAMKLLSHIARAPDNENMRKVTFKPGTCETMEYDKKRIGRPRENWTVDTLKQMWKFLAPKTDTPHLAWDPKNMDIRERIYQAANLYDI